MTLEIGPRGDLVRTVAEVERCLAGSASQRFVGGRLAASLRAAGPRWSLFTEPDTMGRTFGGSERCAAHEGAVRKGDVAGLDHLHKMSGGWPLRHNRQPPWHLHLGAHPQPNCRLHYSESVPGCVSPRTMGRRWACGNEVTPKVR